MAFGNRNRQNAAAGRGDLGPQSTPEKVAEQKRKEEEAKVIKVSEDEAALPTSNAVQGVKTSVRAPTPEPSNTKVAIINNLNDPTNTLEDKGLVQTAEFMDPDASGTVITPDTDIPIPGDIKPVEAEAAKVTATAKADVTQIQDDEITLVGTTLAEAAQAEAVLATASLGTSGTTTAGQSTAETAEAAQLAEAAQAQVAQDVLANDFEVETISPDEIVKSLDAIRDESPMVAASMTTEMNALLDALDSGDIPAWAKPAVTQVEKMLASRGLSASSIGRDALFNAIIQSAMPIAQTNAQFKQDASKTTYTATVNAIMTDTAAANAALQFNASSINQKNQFMSGLRAQIDTQNAQRRDAISQFNASQKNQFAITQASLDTDVSKANAQLATQVGISNAALATQASATNAQLATQTSLANAASLTATSAQNAQLATQTAAQNAQLATQVGLANTAAENRASEVNAAARNQARLVNQAAQNLAENQLAKEKNLNTRFNAAAESRASEFNSAAANELAKFSASLQNNVEQFNSQQSLVIAQSNAQWRRQVNTSNTAIENQVNMTNTMNAFNLNNQALSFLWQSERDEASWFEQATQNDLDRFNRLEATVLGNEAGAEAQKGALFANILTAVGNAMTANDNMN